MIFEPLYPLPVLIVLGIVMVGGCLIVGALARGRRFRWLMRAVASLLLLTALARPGFPEDVATQQAEASVQVFLVVDISASIAAEDFDGDKPRLDGVVADISDLLEAMPGAKFSMLTFASSAALRVPLTTDDAAIRSALDVLEPEPARISGGSSPTEASLLLNDRLAKGREYYPGEEQYVLYFGDGEKTSTNDAAPFKLAQPLAGGAVFGYGTPEGGRMLENLDTYEEQYGGRKPEYIQDPATGEDAVSKIDEETLQTIAKDLGVEYIKRSAGQAITSDFTVPDFETRLVDRSGETMIQDYFWIPLIAVFMWIVVEGINALRRIREVAAIGRRQKA